MNIAKERHDTEIKNMAEIIKGNVKGGTLYGYPVDMNNPDEILVAVYYREQMLGREKELTALAEKCFHRS